MTISALLGNAALMRRAMAGEDLRPLGQTLLERATNHPEDAHALMDLSMILQLTGQRELALQVQRQALELTTHYHLPATQPRAGQPPLRLLAFMTPGDLMTNTPLDCLLEHTDVALDMLYLGDGLSPPDELPEHDLLFIAIGASDRTAPLLAELAEVTRDWPRPVINRPERTAWTARDAACVHLHDAPGIVMPLTARLSRDKLACIGRHELPLTDILADGRFPIIARPVDTHAGHGLMKLDTPAEIAVFLAQRPATENEFHIARFVDYRNADGQYRKYRIVLIAGRPYACHMGISQHWMIHYLNAGMDESAAKRAEEERFMESFERDFAPRHAAAFTAMYERLGLDYLVIDCADAPAPAGGLLVFEVDTGAVVHAMDPVALYPYKPVQMQKAFDAFRTLLGAQ
ncbi:MAG: RimK family alpha-L-glutamate ligase [Sterolibacterium sp.]|jgi:hypothetical protein|nr:RimK family alpha-L-glutamate ligase [Sterolibacterium sp.]